MKAMRHSTRQSPAILVVDDNESIHDDFDRILAHDHSGEVLAEREAEFFGQSADSADTTVRFQVDHAFQGKSAVDMVQQAVDRARPYSVAFVDARMPPGWDGIQTVRRMWQVDPDLHVVICTACSEPSLEPLLSEDSRPGQLLILKKPFDPAEVAQLASAMSDKRRLLTVSAMQTDRLQEMVETRTQQLEQARQESEQLFEAISSIVIGLDEHGCVSRWNGASETVFQITAAEIIGRSFRDIPVEWEDAETVEQLLLHVGSNGTRRNEMVFTDIDGIRRVLGASISPVCVNGQRRGCLVLGADLTETRLLEQQLQAAQKLEAVGQLAAGAAHEINTPLQYIGDNLQYLTSAFEQLTDLLDRQLNPPEPDQPGTDEQTSSRRSQLVSLQRNIPAALSDSIEGVTHVSQIVRAMKEFSHPGMESVIPVDLNEALQNTLTVSSSEWKHVASVMTDFAVPARTIEAFAGELNQAFLNLIVNAAQAIADSDLRPGQIHLTTRFADDCAEVRISDTGCGIPKDIQNRVFDPFFTTKEVGRGTGQGLALAHSIITQKHGGRLWFDSEEAVGTTFWIQLPYCTSSAEAPSSELAMTVGSV